MRRRSAVQILLSLVAVPSVVPLLLPVRVDGAQAPATDVPVGTTIVSVEVEASGRPVRDPQVLALVGVKVGDALEPAAIRAAIAHLVQLGFDDVVVRATPRTGGVDVRYSLVPHRTIVGVDFLGDTGLSERRLRRALEERFGRTPAPTQLTSAEQVVRTFLAERGYLGAQVTGRVDPGAAPERARLVFEIDAGRRSRVGAVRVSGTPPVPAAIFGRRLGLTSGAVFDRAALDRRVDREVRALQKSGHYEARIDIDPRPRESGVIDVGVDVAPGPLVSLVVQGDELPKSVRDTYIPVAREGSVDEDLLEDAQRALERYLRDQGFRTARVEYSRVEHDESLAVTFTVKKGRLHRVEQVTITGNRSISSAELQALLPMKVEAPFVESSLDVAESAIRAHYLDRGFTAVRIGASAATMRDAAVGADVEPMEVTIAVDEGVPLRLGTVEFVGREVLPEATLVEAAGLVIDAPFIERGVVAARDALERTYRELGYREVVVEPRATPDADTGLVHLVFYVTEGPQIRVGKILVAGNSRIATSTIEREIRISEGVPLSPDLLVDAQRRVAALGLFRRVDIREVGDVGSTVRDVVLAVDEAPPTTIGYGGGLEAGSRSVADTPTSSATERVEFAWRTFFEIGRRNLFGKNRSVNLFSRASLRRKNATLDTPDPSGRSLGFNEYRVIGTYREPRVFDRAANAQFSGFLEQAIRPSFSFVRRGAQAELSTLVGTRVSVIGRYAYDRTRLFDEQLSASDQPLIDRVFPQVTLSTFSIATLRDTRDDPLEPTRGTLVGLDQTVAARVVGSAVGFSKSFVQGAFYRKLGAERTVFAARLQVGLAHGFPRLVPALDADGQPVLSAAGVPLVDTVRDLPASERFFAGGATTVRGFALDRLGDSSTLRDDGFPTGGNALVVVNAELRFPVWRSVGAAMFFDAGNVFARASDLDFGQLRGSPGLGLRYRSPLGPIRVDLGFKLDRRTFRDGNREQLTAIHISIGQAF